MPTEDFFESNFFQIANFVLSSNCDFCSFVKLWLLSNCDFCSFVKLWPNGCCCRSNWGTDWIGIWHNQTPGEIELLQIEILSALCIPCLKKGPIFVYKFVYCIYIYVYQTSLKCATAWPLVIDSEGPSSIIRSPNIRCFVAKPFFVAIYSLFRGRIPIFSIDR